MPNFFDRFLTLFASNRAITQREMDRTIALAGIFQAATLVKQWAHHGKMDEQAFTTQINSVLELSPASVEQIYGGAQYVQMGLKQLRAFFTQSSEQRDKELMSYVIGLIVLQRKLAKSPQAIETIRARIPFVNTQIAHYSLTNPIVIANLADIYIKTLSQFKMRIQVKGAKQNLDSDAGMNMVRALLLTGIRAAVLWEQLGGEFYQLFFTRARLARVAEYILTTFPPLSTQETV